MFAVIVEHADIGFDGTGVDGSCSGKLEASFDLVVQRMRCKICDRTFTIAAYRAWN